MTDWTKQYPSVWVTRKYDGDKDRARVFYGEGNKLLYQLKNFMRLGNLDQLMRRRLLKDMDGNLVAEIIAKSVFGHDEIYINSPYVYVEEIPSVVGDLLVFFDGPEDLTNLPGAPPPPRVALVDMRSLSLRTSRIPSKTIREVWPDYLYEGEYYEQAFVRDWDHLVFKSFQSRYQYQLPTGTVIDLFQSSGNWFLVDFESGFISNGLYPQIVEYMYEHKVYDPNRAMFFELTKSDIIWGPTLINSENLLAAKWEYGIGGAYYNIYKYIYDGSSVNFEDYWEIPWEQRGFGPFDYPSSPLPPLLIDTNLNAYYARPVFCVLSVYNLSGIQVGVDISICINGILFNYVTVSETAESIALGIAGAINARFPGLAAPIGRHVFLYDASGNGIDVGVERILLIGQTVIRLLVWNQRPFGIGAYRSETYRKFGYKLSVDRNLKIGDHLSFADAKAYTWAQAIWKTTLGGYPSPHSGACDVCGKLSGYHYPAVNQVMTEAQTKEDATTHIAGDLDGMVNTTASANGNIITIVRESVGWNEYGEMTDPYWWGPISAVDYYCHYYPMRLFGLKVRKVKLFDDNAIVEDVESDSFSLSGTGSYFNPEYWSKGPTLLYELVHGTYDPPSSQSFSQEVSQVIRGVSLVADPVTGLLSYGSYPRNIGVTRNSQLVVQGSPTVLNRTITDTMTGQYEVTDLFKREASWGLNFSERRTWSEDVSTSAFDGRWQVNDNGGEIHFMNFPFSTIAGKPFCYTMCGSDFQNAESIFGENPNIVIDRYLNYKAVYPAEGDCYYEYNTCSGNFDSNLGDAQTILGTPYETVILNPGESVYDGWIHIQDAKKNILIQGVLIQLPVLSKDIGNQSVPNLRPILYFNGVRIEEQLASALGTTPEKLLGMIYVPNLKNDPGYSKFL